MSKRSLYGGVFSIGACVLGVVIAVSLLIFVRLYSLPTGSMEPTLLLGDHLVALRSHSTVHSGDIVIFRFPPDPQQTYVKRVAGIAGDRVKILNRMLFVNGKKLSEPYAKFATSYADSYKDNFPSEPNAMVYPGALDMLAHHVRNGEVIVPQGALFVLGDNREMSLDSRYWGFVPMTNVIGQPLFVYLSKDPGRIMARIR